ncbi:hypothetical protein [Deinococcus aquiradiocola]|uniref:Uncharacterized protein n=1 Tax=Deinococcus aquiradiocola TaxID=393059 RepID=A0A917P567_9DEIO|nr:hypothetical protein [Deinococcus aquiradiocola]GGJ62217.1 hypothetical protein GCM10008939_02570 [Deinococcus aquiradiocola]
MTAPGPVPRPAEPRPRPAAGVPLTPARRRRIRDRNLTLLRLAWGLMALALLAFTLWQPGDWPVKLGAWVLLTLLADESGGWYGYLGTALGVLPYFSSHAPPAQWLVILPLVGAALIAGLIVKHAGGPLVLPFAFAAFALPILLTERLGPSLDTTLTLPSNAQFRASSLGLAAAALAFSFVRQALGIYLRRRAEQPHPVSAPPLPDAGLPDA